MLELNKIYNIDCLEGLKQLDDNSIDSIVMTENNDIKELYKNKEWLKNEIVNKKRSMADIGKQFNKDITTIRYWVRKFNIPIPKETKYPIKQYICPVCGKQFTKRVVKKCQAVYCSRQCAYKGRSMGITKRHIEKSYNTHPTKVKLRCLYCGKEFVVNKTHKNHKYCSRSCFLKSHKISMMGSYNPSWQGGKSYYKRCYRGIDWEEQRQQCYKRDNYTCQICGVKCVSRRDLSDNNGNRLIQCHHINEYKTDKNNNLDNLVTLCASCHKKLHEGIIKLYPTKN